MKPCHAILINAMPEDTRRDIAIYFGIRYLQRIEFKSPSGSHLMHRVGVREKLLSEKLAERGLGQADVVLALLRLDRMMEVEWLLGRRVTHCPSVSRHLPPLPTGSDLEKRSGDDRRIVSVGVNTALPTTGRFYRFRIFRQGMTVTQAITRGVTRRDIRIAAKRKMIVLEGAT